MFSAGIVPRVASHRIAIAKKPNLRPSAAAVELEKEQSRHEFDSNYTA